jgi:hypothetical protein
LFKKLNTSLNYYIVVILMSDFIETAPIDETKQPPVGIVYGRHKFCPDCIIRQDFSFNGGQVFKVLPCAKHRG